MAIQIRRGTDAQWEALKGNIVVGELATTTDTERAFLGTGNGTYFEMANIDLIADEFSPSVSYANGDCCIQQGKLYRFTSEHSGAWTGSDVEQITVGDIKGDSIGDSVPSTVRSAIFALFEAAAYAETGLDDEIAVIESWASEVTSISLSANTLSLNGDTPQTLVATTVPVGSTVIWSSSDDTIATVANGVVTGVSNGNCTITASAGNKSATCAVTVTGFATLESISAAYTQSGTVYDTDSLDSLKADLVVTATYSDSSTKIITNYVLSGTLAEGTSVITVTYAGKTATFNVNVTHKQAGMYDDSTKWTNGYVMQDGTINSTDANGVMYYNEFIPVADKDYIYLSVDDDDWSSMWIGVAFYSAEDFSSFVQRTETSGSSSTPGETGNATYIAFGNVAMVEVPSGASYAIVSARNIANYYTEAKVWTTVPIMLEEDTFDNSLWRTGYITNNFGINTSPSQGEMYLKRAIKVKPNTTYRFSNSDGNWSTSWVGWYLISDSYTYGSRQTSNVISNQIDITTDNDTGWLWISSRNMSNYYTTATLAEVE